jgi:uncharacterized protein (TIGR03118 family)
VRKLAITALAVGVASLSIALPASTALGKKLSGQYAERDLVSSVPGAAELFDPLLVNPWGLAFNPAGGAAWVADNATGVSTLYTGATSPTTPITKNTLTVTIPGGAPTGAVFNDTTAFVISDGVNIHPAAFLFASESGNISAWHPTVAAGPSGPPATVAVTGYSDTAGAIFKGLALGTAGTENRLYATDFHNGRVVVLNANFQQITVPGGFRDPAIPTGYAPFGIENIGGKLYVTYAKQDAAAEDDVAAKGNGFVDVYDTDGNLLSHLAAGGPLNSPWGMALAPGGFGAASNALLVGNFGDGHINAYDPATGELLGYLRDENGKKLTIDGLWALRFGNGVTIGTPLTLLFTAGPVEETQGLFGALTPVPPE